MKTCSLILVALLAAFACQSQPTPGLPAPAHPTIPPPVAPAVAAPAREPVNYLIRVEWKTPEGEPKAMEVVTTEGRVQLDSLQKNSVKINNNEVPITLRFNGTLNVINNDKGRLQLFLGRTVPYVTGSSPNGMSNYQQMSVGLDSTFVVTFGKPLVIQTDENGQITVLVKRLAD